MYLYAVKHNPFAYFASVQEGRDRALSLEQVVSFDGPHGLYADLKAGHVPDLRSLRRTSATTCMAAATARRSATSMRMTTAPRPGLNPSLILQGDLAVQRIVTAIKASPVWSEQPQRDRDPVGRERLQHRHLESGGDHRRYQLRPHQVQSARFYDHYSLTKTLDAAFRLPCLNHACDAGVEVMSDLFQE